MSTQVLFDKLQDLCRDTYGKRLVSLAVFGSMGRGTACPDSDIMREAQEIVELALKGMLRQIGIEPPMWHDISSLIIEYRARFPESVGRTVERLAEISLYLRKEREISFYGDMDFIPTEKYSLDDAKFVVGIAEQVINPN